MELATPNVMVSMDSKNLLIYILNVECKYHQHSKFSDFCCHYSKTHKKLIKLKILRQNEHVIKKSIILLVMKT